MTDPICFLDTETDGLHPGRKPWEIAIVRREPDGTEIEWQAFVDIDLSTADRHGLSVGRFHERHPLGQVVSQLGRPWIDRYGMSRENAARSVAQLTHGARIVGANPSFDTETLDPLLRAHGLLPAWRSSWCVTTLAVGFLASKGQHVESPWKPGELPRLLGVEPSTAEELHTAMGDVQCVIRMYDAIMPTGGVVQDIPT